MVLHPQGAGLIPVLHRSGRLPPREDQGWQANGWVRGSAPCHGGLVILPDPRESSSQVLHVLICKGGLAVETVGGHEEDLELGGYIEMVLTSRPVKGGSPHVPPSVDANLAIVPGDSRVAHPNIGNNTVISAVSTVPGAGLLDPSSTPPWRRLRGGRTSPSTRP